MTTHTLPPTKYTRGWVFHQVWQDGRWHVTAIRDGREVRQGSRTREQLLDALDRIDGRPVLRDYLDALDRGLPPDVARVPASFDDQGYPLKPAEAVTSGPRSPDVQAQAMPPIQPGTAVQLSLFDLIGDSNV